MIGTKGIKEDTKEFMSKYIEPGIHEVKVTKVIFTEVEGKSPYLTFNFENKTGQTADIKFYVSEASRERTLMKIKHLGTKVVDETTLDTVTGKNYTEYAKNLTHAIAGKWLRIKFSGEMIVGGINAETGEKKRDWAKATIGLPRFAENLATNPTRLTYDPNPTTNPKGWMYDLKPLETSSVETTSYNGVSGNNDLSF